MKSDIILPLKPKFGSKEHIALMQMIRDANKLEHIEDKIIDLELRIIKWEKDYNERTPR